jgi:predicted ATPase
MAMIEWLETISVDAGDRLRFDHHKMGRSQSRLYFRDRFMREDNDLFSAENANEGILHLLFHLAVFLSAETPRVFAVDNLETALNPQLCRLLVTSLAALAVEREKQAFVTTHNPAVLDGLDLHDDRQRLFIVSRDGDGHTKVKRLTAKPQLTEGKYKLSELWMRGHLGGLPDAF